MWFSVGTKIGVANVISTPSLVVAIQWLQRQLMWVDGEQVHYLVYLVSCGILCHCGFLFGGTSYE